MSGAYMNQAALGEHIQHCAELQPRTASEKAAYLEGVAEGRRRAARDAAQAAPAHNEWRKPQ